MYGEALKEAYGGIPLSQIRAMYDKEEKDSKVDKNSDNNYTDLNRYSVRVPSQEYAKLSSMLAQKNGNKPRKTEYAYTDKYFYVVKNNKVGNFDISVQLDIETNGDLINDLTRSIDNGTYRKARDFTEWLRTTKSGKGSNDRYSLNGKRAEADGRDVEVHREQSKGNGGAVTRKSSGDTQQKLDDIRYSLTKSFSEQVDDVLSGKDKGYNHLKLSETPKLLVQAGINDLPLLMTKKHLLTIINGNDKNVNYHGLGVEAVKKIT